MQNSGPSSEKKHLRTSNPVVQAASYTLAVAAGLVTAGFKVWDGFYSKIKRTDLISGLSDARYEQTNAVCNEAKIHGMSYKEYAKRVSDIEHEYSRQVNQVLKSSIGIESEGLGAIKGTFQRLDALGPYKKSNILFTALATTGTTIGAYLLVNQNFKLKHELKQLHHQLNDTTPQR